MNEPQHRGRRSIHSASTTSPDQRLIDILNARQAADWKLDPRRTTRAKTGNASRDRRGLCIVVRNKRLWVASRKSPSARPRGPCRIKSHRVGLRQDHQRAARPLHEEPASSGLSAKRSRKNHLWKKHGDQHQLDPLQDPQMEERRIKVVQTPAMIKASGGGSEALTRLALSSSLPPSRRHRRHARRIPLTPAYVTTLLKPSLEHIIAHKTSERLSAIV